MTSNQIAYQKMVAEKAEREAKTRALNLENEMTDLENRQEKYWHYGISDPNDKTITKAFPLEAYRRGITEAKRLLGLFGGLTGGKVEPEYTYAKHWPKK